MLTLAWILAIAALAGATVAVLVRDRNEQAALPLTDPAGLGQTLRRARRSWLLLVALTAAAALLLARELTSDTSGATLIPQNANAVVVLDASRSTVPYYGEIADSLERLTQRGSRHIGLVLVSDVAYEALPPTSGSDALEPWVSRLRRSLWISYPWGGLSGGTRLSVGLRVARQAILRDKVESPHILFFTDLSNDRTDLVPLVNTVSSLKREGIALHVISLGAGQRMDDEPNWHNADFILPQAAQTIVARVGAKILPQGPSLLALATLFGLLAVVLSAHELRFLPIGRLR